MNTDTLIEMLSTILDCGSADVAYLAKELEVFEIDFYDAWQYCTENEIQNPTMNNLIYAVYYLAVQRAEIDEEQHEVSIFTNYLDSHLNIKVNGEEWEEFYSADDLQKLSA